MTLREAIELEDWILRQLYEADADGSGLRAFAWLVEHAPARASEVDATLQYLKAVELISWHSGFGQQACWSLTRIGFRVARQEAREGDKCR